MPFLVLLVSGTPSNSRLVWFIVPELAVFALEDATTIFVWCETGEHTRARARARAHTHTHPHPHQCTHL